MAEAGTLPASLAASAPHLAGASTWAEDLADWGVQPDAVEGVSRSSGRLLWKGAEGQPEVGLWVCTPGRWRLTLPADEFCHFVAGRAIYRAEGGEVIEVGPGTVVHFPRGWTGECEVLETLRNLYMLA
ncbi:cupin domain-containing protein [Pelagibius marinus]|uniref:cupin domain-containing protein n=1 Tax=Pelagibius marinus TaxID=2762760 RepID=UPI0018727291|nr:cupin domain-containing protein [Pelagibius marinus]